MSQEAIVWKAIWSTDVVRALTVLQQMPLKAIVSDPSVKGAVGVVRTALDGKPGLGVGYQAYVRDGCKSPDILVFEASGVLQEGHSLERRKRHYQVLFPPPPVGVHGVAHKHARDLRLVPFGFVLCSFVVVGGM